MHRKVVFGLILVVMVVGATLWSQTPQIVALRAGRLFDSKSGQLLTDQIVIVEGERITEVGPVAQVHIPSGAHVIDLTQATVLPGLIDCHVHTYNNEISDNVQSSKEFRAFQALANAQKDLRGGFTTVRDMSTHGLESYGDVDVRNVINAGMFEGPRMQVSTRGIGSGFLGYRFTADVHLEHHNQETDSPWEGRKAVREQVHFGADWIKVYSDGYAEMQFVPPADGKGWGILDFPAFTFEEMNAIVDETHRLGKHVACHTFGGVEMQDCVRTMIAGDSIEHAIDLDEPTAEILRQKGIYLDLTIRDYWFEKGKLARDLKRTGGKWSLAQQHEKSARMAIAMKGLKIVFGSGESGSGPDSGTQAPEFEYLVKYGMTPERAVQSATTVAAEMLGWQDQIGSIEKGKYADIIAVSGNPLSDITELERVKFVMKGGKVVRNDLK